MLEALGVDAAAETIYRAMLRQPDAGIAELAAALDWPHERVRSALDELGRLCLLRPSYDDSAAVRPVPPEVGLEAILARRETELLRRQHEVEEGRAALRVLVAESAAYRPYVGADRGIDELAGVDAVRDALDRLAYDTREEVLTFVPGGGQTPAALAASGPLNERLLRRGVRMRTIYLNSARNDPATTRHAQWLSQQGAQVRTVPALPLRLLVSDRRVAVLPTDPGDTAAGACLVRRPGIVAAACALFEQHWRTSTPWGARPEGSQPAVTGQERALLTMLVAGDTDDQAARKLGVSSRTVGRMAAGLMARLGARSRFQAGALAAARGWVSFPDDAGPV